MTPDHQLLQFAQLFDCLEDVLAWVKDAQGRYRWVNRAFVLNYEAGLPPGSPPTATSPILGKSDYDLSPSFLADQFRSDDEQVLAGNRVVDRIELVGQPDGVARWHVTNKLPLLDGKGRIVATAGLTRRLPSQDRSAEPDSGFGRVLGHLRDHYHTNVTNQQLAEVAHMSVRAFERRFLREFHLTPQHYLRKLRMRMASRALVFTRQTLSEAAQSCGFSDQSHFTREFRRYFGRTPGEYREHYASRPELAAMGTNSAASGQAR